MRTKSIAASLGCICLLAAAGTAPAAAAICDNRPGTPNQTSGEETSATSIRFKFRITTRDNEINKFYDYYVTQKPGNKQVVSQTGVRSHGPYYLGFGSIDYVNVNDLKPGGEYCFYIRARSERGTKGCVSAQWAAPACVKIAGGPSASPNAPGPFGAVAADGKGAWGYAVAQASEAQARTNAVKGCGNANCKVELSGRGTCAAYAQSRANGGYWYGLGLSTNNYMGAREAAERGCAKGAPKTTCKIQKTYCTTKR
jgi:hypothetical protein